MGTVAGIYNSRSDAEGAVERLRAIGMPDRSVSILSPGATEEEIEATVPTTDTEQPGMGAAVGGVVGGAMGAAGGATIGAAAASLLVPGVGPVIAAGILGAALLGAGGVAAGATAGDALEDAIATGVPHDELFVYEDALRKGRTVVIVVTEDDEHAETVRNVVAQSGAESIDAARENWWIGLRDAEAEKYQADGRDFEKDEKLYRLGFESALHPEARGRGFEERTKFLRTRHGDLCMNDAFKCGYESGQRYQQDLHERYNG